MSMSVSSCDKNFPLIHLAEIRSKPGSLQNLSFKRFQDIVLSTFDEVPQTLKSSVVNLGKETKQSIISSTDYPKIIYRLFLSSTTEIPENLNLKEVMQDVSHFYNAEDVQSDAIEKRYDRVLERRPLSREEAGVEFRNLLAPPNYIGVSSLVLLELLARQADLNPLAQAIISGNLEKAYALAHVENLQQPLFDGFNIFHLASMLGDPEILKSLLPHFSQEDRSIALHLACRANNLDAMSFFIRQGFEVNKSDVSTPSPIEVAIGVNQVAALKLLVDAGANLPPFSMYIAATRQCSEEMIQFLVEQGIDIDNVDEGCHPIHGCVESENPSTETLKALIKHGANIHAHDRAGNSSLHLAKESDILDVLINGGLDLEARNDAGQTPLLFAVDRNRPSEALITALIERGADIHALDPMGNSLLHLVRSESSLRLLINAGLNLEARNNAGETPLHCAVANGLSLEELKILIRNGANIYATTPDGRTVLDHIRDNIRYRARYSKDITPELKSFAFAQTRCAIL